MLILTCKDDRCLRLLRGEDPGRRFPADLKRRTVLQLAAIDKATRLEQLRDPPGNRLEVLGDDRAGQHSVRINRQLRICFRWTPDGATDVEFVDSHR